MPFMPELVRAAARHVGVTDLRVGPLSPESNYYDSIDPALTSAFPQIAMSVGGALVERIGAGLGALSRRVYPFERCFREFREALSAGLPLRHSVPGVESGDLVGFRESWIVEGVLHEIIRACRQD